jgi:hypothetical protein
MVIRLSSSSDAPQILDIYAKARSVMAEQGNPTQWAKGAPNEESLKKDLAHKASYVVEDDGRIVGTFALYHNDLNYVHIDGKWLNEEPYVVLHRMASMKKGVGSFILKTICGQYPNVRIDTHQDNISMKNLLKKMGFVYCGIIPLLDKDNSLREAYMKISIL